ncbi:unnamed protein product, partial [Musa hybrid cultivar]
LTSSPLILHQQQQQHRPPKTRGQRHEATIAFASQPTQLPKGVCRNACPPPQNGTLQLCLEPPSLQAHSPSQLLPTMLYYDYRKRMKEECV